MATTIEGTTGNDHIIVEGNDELYFIYAYTGTDVIDIRTTSGARSAAIFLDDGGDTIHGGFHDDVISFRGAANRLYGGEGNDTFALGSVGAGNLIDGGDGTDSFSAAYAGADGAFITLAEGRAAVRSGPSGLTWQYDLRDIEDLTGTSANDILVGDDGANTLQGGYGHDLLSGCGGDDTLMSYDDPTPSGNDVFVGGLGADDITTANGDDVIRIDRLVESLPGQEDRVTDFSSRDILDLSRIDADQTAAGDQAFTLIGDAPFSHTAGELRYQQLGRGLLVSADADGDGRSDMQVILEPTWYQGQALTRLTADDVLL
ncbi:Ca2+-binding RTX toxin-like protein [Inquilinus ginsengisoli]|uniref:calcium-binding protein n=1 Tax=Inquilinus ginsengisoli TaxID=363840 RepID=UPI003D236DEA